MNAASSKVRIGVIVLALSALGQLCGCLLEGDLTLEDGALPQGTVGQRYSVALTAVGGHSPLVWSLAGGALPPGLGLDQSAGVIAGVPEAPGAFSFTVRVLDGRSRPRSATGTFSIAVAAPALTQPTLVSPGTTDGPGPFVASLVPTLSWDPVQGAGRYIAKISETPLGSGAVTWESPPVSELHVAVPVGVLEPAHGYRWNVRAGNSESWSAPSASLYFQTGPGETPPPPPPVPPSPET